jgi:hypothetical protein
VIRFSDTELDKEGETDRFQRTARVLRADNTLVAVVYTSRVYRTMNEVLITQQPSMMIRLPTA